MKNMIFPLVVSLLFFSGCSGSSDNVSAQTEGPLPVSKSFTLIQDDMDMIVSDIPEISTEDRDAIGKAISSDSRGFLDLAGEMLKEDPSLFTLVDKQHPLESSFVPADLADLDDIGLLKKNKPGMQIRRIALPSLIEMTRAAEAEGLKLLHSSAYRSYVYQVKTFNYWVEQMGREEAEKVSAVPGRSQHQLGLALDFGNIDDSYEQTPEGIWQLENAWKYGWSLSFPKGKEDLTGYSYECWHYRYIGKAAAQMERKYFQGLQQNLLVFWQEKADYLKESLTDSGLTEGE